MILDLHSWVERWLFSLSFIEKNYNLLMYLSFNSQGYMLIDSLCMAKKFIPFSQKGRNL